jgi:hypothetical protein
MSEFRRRWSFSFAIGLALCLVCLAYIPQWQSYAPRVEESMPSTPYLTPWTVIFVSILSLSLAIIAVPVRTASVVQTIISKTLGVCVLCLATIFLLEYISGIRAPDLDLFFLPDGIGHRVKSAFCACAAILRPRHEMAPAHFPNWHTCRAGVTQPCRAGLYRPILSRRQPTVVAKEWYVHSGSHFVFQPRFRISRTLLAFQASARGGPTDRQRFSALGLACIADKSLRICQRCKLD